MSIYTYKTIGNQWLCIFFFAITFMLTSCGQWFDYGENKRRESFNKNFNAFQKLEQMQRENLNVFAISIDNFKAFKETQKDACTSYKHNNIEYSFCYEFMSNSGLTDERWSEYKKLLAQANLHLLIYQYDEPKKRAVRFYDKENVSDSGYVYMEYPPPKAFNSFLECDPIMPSNTCYVVLRKNWYMFSENFKLKQENAK